LILRRSGPGLALVALALCACATSDAPRGVGRIGGVAAVAQGLSDQALERLVADMDPAMLALARRHDPGRLRADLWGRPVGWASLDIATLPTLGVAVVDLADAQRINALKPAHPEALRPVAPFVLPATGAERDRALQCLAQAVYYEAGAEPLDGRRAVAQTVINRLRHPGYPKSVCGVVFEGAARTAGCQFSFTCDGSMDRPLISWMWEQAQEVASMALSGYVYAPIGTATHYHADYALPYWAPTLLKLGQVGAHIFYRWTGPAGEPRAFNRRYAGGELSVSAEVLNAVDERIQGAAAGLAAAPVPQRMAGVEGLVSVVAVPDAEAPGGQRLQMSGAIAGRRIPTPEEIARINALLAAMPESKASATPAPATAPE
jgi:spore germination cell wall hydrolase CwlJ-like protein